MLFWTIQVTIISIILIFLVHHLLVFFKTNLTTPKVKDLVNAPTQKYDAIFNAMNFSAMNTSSANSVNINNISLEELLPPIQPDPVDMKNELKQFMKKQFKENNNNPSNSTINLDTFNSSSSSTMQYSSY
jgi:hypothetical protein